MAAGEDGRNVIFNNIIMKLVYIYHSIAAKGGLERIFCDKMNYFVQNCGYDVTFISYQQGKHPLAYKLDERIKVVDLNTRFIELYKYNAILRVFKNYFLRKLLKKRLSRQLSEERPDLVICTTVDLSINECFMDLPYSFIIESHLFMDRVLDANIHEAHGLKRCFLNFIDKWHIKKFNKAKVLVTLTRADKKDWSKHLSTDIRVIPNMVTYYPERIKPYNERPNRIICAGRLDSHKGFNYIIEAWSMIAHKYNNWRIDIFGHGEEEIKLNNLIEIKNLCDCIKIHKPSDNIYNEYLNSSLYVLSSKSEGFGLVLIEALSCGVPCISFNCPNGPAEIIRHGENGILVPLADVEKLAESIEWMITHKDDRFRMSSNARLTAEQYQADTIMPQWVKLFEDVINSAT